jgi:hypothetical protein
VKIINGEEKRLGDLKENQWFRHHSGTIGVVLRHIADVEVYIFPAIGSGWVKTLWSKDHKVVPINISEIHFKVL